MNNIFDHLKSPKVILALKMKDQIKKSVRSVLEKDGFLEIDTPILSPQVPEYTNNQFRVYGENNEEFFLPQSPQVYKQIIMNSGIEKYYQFGHCFRYGEYDKDHSNEFIQIDVEMHTDSKELLMHYVEKIIRQICYDLGVDKELKFDSVSGEKCVDKFGSDKPDLRTHKDEYRFLWIKDLPMIESSEFERIKVVSSELEIGKKSYILSHHAFAKPLNWSYDNIDVAEVKTDSFDLILNGIEICSGDIRINDAKLQRSIFDKFGISTNHYETYLSLLRPHISNGGFAIGLDRLVMALMHSEKIIDTLPFYEGWYK